LDGKQESFYLDGQQHRLISYRHGVLHGQKCDWAPSGELIEEAHYVEGRLEGRHQTMDGSGQVIVYHYQDNRKEGLHLVYYPLDKQLQGEEEERVVALSANYHLGKLNGPLVEYSPRKKRLSLTPYVVGRKEGKALLFHKNGTVAVELPFVEDRREGVMCQYYETGQLHREVLFEGDQESGPKKTFYTSGALESVEHYASGKREGGAKHWNTGGILLFEGHYRDGVEHGDFAKYYEDGRPYVEQTFFEGKLHGVKIRYMAGGKVKRTTYEHGVLLESNTSTLP